MGHAVRRSAGYLTIRRHINLQTTYKNYVVVIKNIFFFIEVTAFYQIFKS